MTEMELFKSWLDREDADYRIEKDEDGDGDFWIIVSDMYFEAGVWFDETGEFRGIQSTER